MADPTADDELKRSLRAYTVTGHRRGAGATALASLLGALGTLVLLRNAWQVVAALAWLSALSALSAVQLWRWAVVRQPRVAAGADPGALAQLRLISLVHGTVWACVAWLVPWPWTPEQLGMVVVSLAGALMAGVAVGLMYDALAAALFALAPVLVLGLVLALHGGAWPRTVGLALVILLLGAVTLGAAARAMRRGLRVLVAELVDATERGRRSAESESMLRRVFDHIGQGLCMFDADARLVAWNTRMAEMAGIRLDQVRTGVSLRSILQVMAANGDFGSANPQAEVDRRLAAIVRPEPAWGRIRRSDGRTIEMHSHPMPEGGFTLLAMDVTEWRASASALAENRALLSLLLKNTEEGVWTIDNELKTVDANAAMCRMLGLTREQLLGRNIYEFVDEDNAAIFREQVRRRDQGLPGSYQITLQRADGTRVHTQNNPTPLFDAQGRKVGAVGLFSDITAIKQAAADLERTGAELASQTRVLEATLESLSQGVLAVDRQGRVVVWNQRAADLLQAPPGLLRKGMALREVVAWQLSAGYFDRQTSEPTVRSRSEVERYVLGDDTAASVGQYWRERPDGRIIEVYVHRSADGGEVRTYSDVTQRVLAQMALVAARDEAERANRAKSEFLSRMSHELRTPLNAVIGFAQLLERDEGRMSRERRREQVQQILRGGRHLQLLINDVLDLARVESGSLPVQIEPVEVAPLVDACSRLLAPLALERGVRLHLDAPSARVRADATRLQQVLLNLLSNAIKYNRDGGDVRLAGELRAPWLRIEVSDTGPGLTDEQQQRLFRAFERLGADLSTVEGAGIGLALCKSMVDLMQGRIGVRSAPGEGSVFWIELPLDGAPRLPGPPVDTQSSSAPVDRAPAVVAPAPTAPELPAHPAGRRWRVLYIEDNPVNQILMQSMLSRLEGLDLELVDHPLAGLERLRAQAPDLLLLDIQLPEIEGWEVLARLRSDPESAGIPVVAVSANAMASDLQRAREAGFDHYLTKPLDFAEVLQVVCRLVVQGRASRG